MRLDLRVLPRGARALIRRGAAGLLALILTGSLVACDAGSAGSGGHAASSGSGGADDAAATAPVTVRANVPRGADDVAVDTVLEVRAQGASLSRVSVTSPAGAVEGEVSGDGGRWRATDLLEPGTTYTLRSVAERADGSRVTRTSRFGTEDLTLDEQTYASVAPLDGETVGIGMPVVVTFDIPVTDRATVERHLSVTATPAQPGTWHWFSDQEVHYRPKSYWRAGTDVRVDLDINSVPVGNGVHGQESRQVDFHVGDAHVYRVDGRTHQMKVFSNGELLRTLPTTLGKPGFTTRSGVKVVMEKFETRRMNSETVGIPAGSAEAYDIDDVRWAMRLTNSGEFIHAAPWSVGSQGHANVSHGCTGLSTEDAGWLYAMTRRGDVVEYTGTDRPMTLDNGYGDWNASFADYRQASALS